ncbi:MAG: hypothetical protein ACFE0I_12655 [Elainellaceae cyanobacterium]
MTQLPNNRIDAKLDILIDQVGRLTEGLTEIKRLVQRQAETSERQAETSERQAETADRLVRIVEMLIQRQN